MRDPAAVSVLSAAVLSERPLPLCCKVACAGAGDMIFWAAAKLRRYKMCVRRQIWPKRQLCKCNLCVTGVGAQDHLRASVLLALAVLLSWTFVRCRGLRVPASPRRVCFRKMLTVCFCANYFTAKPPQKPPNPQNF